MFQNQGRRSKKKRKRYPCETKQLPEMEKECTCARNNWRPETPQISTSSLCLLLFLISTSLFWTFHVLWRPILSNFSFGVLFVDTHNFLTNETKNGIELKTKKCRPTDGSSRSAIFDVKPFRILEGMKSGRSQEKRRQVSFFLFPAKKDFCVSMKDSSTLGIYSHLRQILKFFGEKRL